MTLNVRDMFSQCNFAKGDQNVQVVEKHDGPSQNADRREAEQRAVAVATVIIIFLSQRRDRDSCNAQPKCEGSGYCQTRDGFLGPRYVAVGVSRRNILLIVNHVYFVS